MWPLSFAEVASACGNLNKLAQAPLEIFGAVTDSRKAAPGFLFVAIRGEKFDGHDFVAQALVQGSPCALVDERGAAAFQQNKSAADLRAVSVEFNSEDLIKLIIVPDVLAAFRLLAAHVRKSFSFPVVAIGGSNGKTTTKEFLSALLADADDKKRWISKTQKSENGFLGIAQTLCSPVHSRANPPAALVLEIGIDETGAMEQHLQVGEPNAALLTALGPEHLQGLGSWENGIQEEFILFRSTPSARHIWQGDEPQLMRPEFLLQIRQRDVVVSHNKSSLEENSQPSFTEKMQKLFAENNRTLPEISLCEWIISGSKQNKDGIEQLEIEISWHQDYHFKADIAPPAGRFTVPLPGIHNAQNFALAAGAALALGRNFAQMQRGLETFAPPPMRSVVTTLANNCTLIDDSYNASPASMQAALELLQSKQWKNRHKIVIIGDMLDLGAESKTWHEQLSSFLSQLNNTRLCLFGSQMYHVLLALKSLDQELLMRRGLTVEYLDADQDPVDFLRGAPQSLSDQVVLVKGSRGMNLERVVKAIERYCGNPR